MSAIRRLHPGWLLKEGDRRHCELSALNGVRIKPVPVRDPTVDYPTRPCMAHKNPNQPTDNLGILLIR